MNEMSIRKLARWCALTTLMVASAAPPCVAAESPGSLVTAAGKALRAGQFDEAISLYDKARGLLPQNAEIPYNMAVTEYRKGDFEKSAEYLKQAIALTNDSKLKAKSVYNLGNAAYAQSLKAMQGQADPNQAAAQMKDAKGHLKEALDNYKKAMSADPSDEDSKANAELSNRLLTQLEKLEQQQQQQQQGDKKDQKDQQQDQQKQDQQQQNNQQDQQKEDEQQQQQQQQQQQSESKQQQQQQKQQQSQEQQSSDQKQQDQQQAQQQQQQKVEKKQADQKQQEMQQASKDYKQPDGKKDAAALQQEKKDQDKDVKSAQSEKKTMSKEEAERLLQVIRDKERNRRAELARREAAKHAPAAKDW